MKYPLTVACDFDGTIAEYAFPGCGPPRTEVIQALRMLRAEGWKIIIHSSRVNSDWPEPGRTQKCEAMIQYLVTLGVPFDEIWGIAFEWLPAEEGRRNYHWWFEPNLTGKPVAHVYLDDRAAVPGPVSSQAPSFQASTLVHLCRRIAEQANAEHKEE